MIKLICIDADDTLWHSEQYYQLAQTKCLELMKGIKEIEGKIAGLMVAGVTTYGFGAKSFTLSMIEAAAKSLGDKFDASTAVRILEIGKDLLHHEVELIEGVPSAIEDLRRLAPLVLVTKGDILHQEAKIADSGLLDLFSAVNIVSDKTAEKFIKIMAVHGVMPSETIVIGDSIRSDILPALEAGAFAAYVPHPNSWSFEQGGGEVVNERYRKFSTLGSVSDWIRQIL